MCFDSIQRGGGGIHTQFLVLVLGLHELAEFLHVCVLWVRRCPETFGISSQCVFRHKRGGVRGHGHGHGSAKSNKTKMKESVLDLEKKFLPLLNFRPWDNLTCFFHGHQAFKSTSHFHRIASWMNIKAMRAHIKERRHPDRATPAPDVGHRTHRTAACR